MSVILDASAMLALLFDEPGQDIVLANSRASHLSAVNFDEVLHKCARAGLTAPQVETAMSRLQIDVVPFDAAQARVSAPWHPALHRQRIAFADRACLALAFASGRALLTCDVDLSKVDVGVDVRLIR